MTEKEDFWLKPFIDFILDQLVPDNKMERECITRRNANYVVIGSDLYRKAASTGILMKCILRSEGLQLLAETDSGECGCHAASTNLVGKAYRSRFYWPTTVIDAKDLVKRCKGCSSLPNSSTCQLRLCALSLHLDPSLYGVSTR
jgi:hypothetical protein